MQEKDRVGSLSDYKLRKLFDESKPEQSLELFDVWTASRRRAQTDLFWLCRLLGYAVTELAHRDICENFSIKKNPDTSLDELQIEKPDRLLWAPRGSYKSSIRAADVVQWILCYPNIKIAIQSSKIDLSSPMVEEVKAFFLAPEDSEGALTLSTIQTLFPEHVAPERSHGAEGTFLTPGRSKFSKEPTVLALSIEESRASTHFDIGYSDDCVSEINSGEGSSLEAREVVARKLLESRNLFDVARFVLGTPQNFPDGYTRMQESLGDDLLLMVKSAWKVKPESAGKPEDALTEDDYVLWFPVDAKGKAKLSYKALKTLQKAGNEGFARNQLCISATAKPEIEITQAMIDEHCLPVGSEAFALNSSSAISTWDLGYSTHTRSDFSVGCAGSRDEDRRAIVKDIQRGQFSKAQLVQTMANQAAKFNLQAIYLESTNGVEWLKDDLLTALRAVGAVTTIVGFVSPDHAVNDAKSVRYERVYNTLKNDELWFEIEFNQRPILQELTPQKGVKRRDDVADSLAHLIRKLKEEPMNRQKEEVSPAQLLLVEKMLRARMYGYTENPKDEKEIEPVFGYRVEELIEEKPTHTEDGLPIYTSETEWLYKPH